jgi:hypothetical protein
VRIAKADLVPTSANLLPDNRCFSELAAACTAVMDDVNNRVHRETMRIPAHALLVEQRRMHPLPAAPLTTALGQTRAVNTDQTIRFGSVRYSTPPGLVGSEVWARVEGDDLVITAATDTGLAEVARHRLSTPGNPRIDLGHYPDHPQDPTGAPKPPKAKARNQAEAAFLALGPGAYAWLVEGTSIGVQRVRTKMAEAVELSALMGTDAVDQALGIAAAAGRFADGDLLSILTYHGAGIIPAGTLTGAARTTAMVIADDAHALQPGTAGWAGFTTTGGVS